MADGSQMLSVTNKSNFLICHHDNMYDVYLFLVQVFIINLMEPRKNMHPHKAHILSCIGYLCDLLSNWCDSVNLLGPLLRITDHYLFQLQCHSEFNAFKSSISSMICLF